MTKQKVLASGGHFVLMCACSERRGWHPLYVETGGHIHGDPKKSEVPDHWMFSFSPNVSEADLYHSYTKNWELYNEWDTLIEDLGKIHQNPKVLVLNTSIGILDK